MKPNQFSLSDFLIYTIYFSIFVGCFGMIYHRLPGFPENVFVFSIFSIITGAIFVAMSCTVFFGAVNGTEHSKVEKAAELKGVSRLFWIGITLIVIPLIALMYLP